MSQYQSQTQQGRNSAQFQLRLPDDLKSRIQDAADISGRSINSEIVAALIEKFSPAQVAARAVINLARYINDADTMTEHQGRVTEAVHFLQAIEPSASVATDRDGTVTISINTL